MTISNKILILLEAFYGLHRQSVILKYGPKYEIGSIAGAKPKIELKKPGEISKVPYAEPSAWQGLPSPYYTYVLIRVTNM